MQPCFLPNSRDVTPLSKTFNNAYTEEFLVTLLSSQQKYEKGEKKAAVIQGQEVFRRLLNLEW